MKRASVWAMVLVLGMGVQGFGAFTYFTESDVPLDQEWTDTLNGRVGVLGQPAGEGEAGSLTDATSASDPSGDMIPAPNNTTWGYITWDLSDLGPQELRKVSIWASGGDNIGRHSIWVHLFVKHGNNTNYEALDVPVYFTVQDNNSQCNHALYTWDAGDVTNVTGLQIATEISFYGLHSRLVEIDADLVPEPATLGLLTLGGLLLRRRNAGV